MKCSKCNCTRLISPSTVNSIFGGCVPMETCVASCDVCIVSLSWRVSEVSDVCILKSFVADESNSILALSTSTSVNFMFLVPLEPLQFLHSQ